MTVPGREAALQPDPGRSRAGGRERVISAPVAFIWGDDSYAAEAAVEAFRARAELFPAGRPDRWRVDVDAGSPGRTIGQLQERLQSATLFGAGTLVVIAGVGPLIRRAEDRANLLELLPLIADGNSLVFVEETESGRKEPPHRWLVDAVRAAGGAEIAVRAPRAGELARWIGDRAKERQIELAPDATRELVERIGGFVTESDVDRRQQGRLAVMELDKLALYRSDGTRVSANDVRDLVPEAIPGSLFAFLDAIGKRNPARAVALADRLLETTAEPVLLAALHRRLRELIEVVDRIESGESPRELPRSMKLNPYFAERLAGQASAWSVPELEAALEGLLNLDAMLKGVPGQAGSDAQRRLALVRWIGERIARAG